MEILGFHMPRRGRGSRIVSLIMTGFALCALRVARKATRTAFMLAPVILALYGRSAAAQSTTTYTYTGNAFDVSACQASGNAFNCVGGSVTATVIFFNLPAGYTNTYVAGCFGSGPLTQKFTIGGGVGLQVLSVAAAGVTASPATPNLQLESTNCFHFVNGSIVEWELDVGVPGCSGACGGSSLFTLAQYPGTGGIYTSCPSAPAYATDTNDTFFSYLTQPPTVGFTQCSPGVWTATSGATPLHITTSTLPNATSGQQYSATIMATGGSGAGYNWSVSSGSLPVGFTLSPAGVLSSTGRSSAQAGSYGFAVQVTDSAGNTGTKALTLTVSVLLTKVSGDNQTGSVSVSSLPNLSPQLPSPLVVKTTDAKGNPAAGVQMSFAITGQPLA